MLLSWTQEDGVAGRRTRALALVGGSPTSPTIRPACLCMQPMGIATYPSIIGLQCSQFPINFIIITWNLEQDLSRVDFDMPVTVNQIFNIWSASSVFLSKVK